MAEDAQVGPAPGSPPWAIDEDDYVDAGPRPGLGIIVAAVVAVAASAGFAWWFAAPDRNTDVAAAPAPAPPPPKAEPIQPLRFAAADPDPNQVRRAWADVKQGYADGGPEALVRASQACAKAVPTDPQSLDYCLAYDRYASTIAQGGEAGAGGADWFADSTGRDLALARTALPDGVDASNRLEQVAALTQAVLPKPAVKTPKLQKVRAVRHAPARPHAIKAKHRARTLHHRAKIVKVAAPVVRKDIPAGDAVLTARDGQSPPPDVILNRGQVPNYIDPPH
jgi:hypothetical protein